MIDITDKDEKYRFIYNSSQGLQCLRYNEEWIVIEKGSKAIISILCELEELRTNHSKLKQLVSHLKETQ